MSTNQRDMIREAMQAIAQRKPGRSKLVYDKTKRTIIAVVEGSQAPQALNITADDADMFSAITISAAWLREQWMQLKETGYVAISFASWDNGDALTHSELCVRPSQSTVPGILLLNGQKTEMSTNLNIALAPTEDPTCKPNVFVSPEGGTYRAEFVGGDHQLLSPPDIVFADVESQLDLRRSGILETTVLKDKTVLCIGLGTGGAHVAVELAKCGVGRFVLVDRDRLSVGNVVRHPEKVSIEVGHGDLSHDDRALEIFVARLLNHPEFANKIRAMVQPAYAELIRKIGASKGVALEKNLLETVLRSSVLAGLSAEASITVWIHNWTKEKFSPPPDYELDWTARFDRSSRRVPAPEIWSTDLVPQLDALRRNIMEAGSVRTIQLRGKCALSTGVAIGSTFPAVGGWTFDISQPPAKEHWRSNANPTPGYVLQTEIVEGASSGTDIVVGLNIRGDGRLDVMRFIETAGQPPNAFVFMSPPTQGSQSIGGEEDACAMAHAVREWLGEILKVRQLRMTRMFVYGPFALSVFLGQQLTSMGQVQLFEYQDPGYVPSCLLRT
jgi:hypothetical protein